MGSSSSKNKRHEEAAKYGQVYVKTDKPAYFGGETVSGQIHMNILMPYPGKKLSLRLKGTEVVHIVLRESSGKHSHENHYRDKNLIINLTVPIYTWDSVVPGQYTIPFAFIVPDGLPSTFHQEGFRYLANISYRLEAILEPNDLKATPKLKYKQNLIVRKPPSKVLPVENERQVTTPIKSCCCCKQGSNLLAVSFEKNWYSPGEVAQARARLDNTNCQLDNIRISFTLRQRLRLQVRSKRLYREIIKVEDQKGGVKKQQTSDNNSFMLKLPPFQEGDYQLTKRDQIKRLLLTIRENNSVMSSATNSKLISSEYILEVSCPMDACCCPTTPVSICPIEIYYPDIQLPLVAAPNNWNPTLMKMATVSFAPPVEMYDQQNLPYNIEMGQHIQMGQNSMGVQNNNEQVNQYQPLSQVSPDQPSKPQYGQNYYG